jgi:hypothetical protein
VENQIWKQGRGIRNWRGSTSPLARTLSKAHSRTVVVQKFNAAFFQRRLDFQQRARLRADVALEGFHAPDGADRDVRRCGKPRLIPSEQDARRA